MLLDGKKDDEGGSEYEIFVYMYFFLGIMNSSLAEHAFILLRGDEFLGKRVSLKMDGKVLYEEDAFTCDLLPTSKRVLVDYSIKNDLVVISLIIEDKRFEFQFNLDDGVFIVFDFFAEDCIGIAQFKEERQIPLAE